MNNKEKLKTVRWQERFHNFEKSFLFLQEGIQKASLNPFEVSGVIKAFEMSFELAWKTLKDFLESKGIDEKFPRDVIKRSFETALIKNGHEWISMLERRNELSFTYDNDEANANLVVVKNEYYPLLLNLYDELKSMGS